MPDLTDNTTVEFTLRIVGAGLTLLSAVALVLIGRAIGSSKLNQILWALIGFFSLFAVLRLVSPFIDVLYSLIAANLIFLLLDIALFIQRRRLKRAAPTVEQQKTRAGAIDEAMNLVLAIKKEMPR